MLGFIYIVKLLNTCETRIKILQESENYFMNFVVFNEPWPILPCSFYITGHFISILTHLLAISLFHFWLAVL